jgi:hypothetical protein
MYRYLSGLLADGFADLIAGKATQKKTQLVNGSCVEILTQSERSVRGHHVQKLRCDEVELFKEEVWSACQFITHSKKGEEGNRIQASMEVFSTMHRPYGLMQEIIEHATGSGRKVYKWCLFEVMERCPDDRRCELCLLKEDCGGKGKKADGYLAVEDICSMKLRASREAWRSEMLCRRPQRGRLVFPSFDSTVHVRKLNYEPDWPLYRAIDPGFADLFVCLWIQVGPEEQVQVIDEYASRFMRVAENAEAIIERTAGPVKATFCDPAGLQRDQTSGASAISELRKAGIKVSCRRSGILSGLEQIRAWLDPAAGNPRILIDSQCERLIKAFEQYHYPEKCGNNAEMPVKDHINDHPIDALRYFFVNCFGSTGKIQHKRY